jgi:arsenical-resistance protein 2
MSCLVQLKGDFPAYIVLGSSRGRGSRAAAWFADHIVEQGNQRMQSLVLREGVKGWAQAGAEYTEHMVEYDNKVWAESLISA